MNERLKVGNPTAAKELPNIEDILGSEIPLGGSIPSLSGEEIRALEVCRIFTKDPKTGRLVQARVRYMGTCDKKAIFVNMDEAVPIVVPEENIIDRSVGILPEPKLQDVEEEIKPQDGLNGQTNDHHNPALPEIDWEKIAESWTTAIDDTDPYPSW